MRESQNAAILRLLIEADGGWVSLPKLLMARGENTIIANIQARMHDLRHKHGYIQLENRKETIKGEVYSWYRLPVAQQGVLL